MKQCWKCRTTTSKNMLHHINGNQEDEKPQNLLRLCVKCHDLIQGICDKCLNQRDCFNQKLQRCWRLEDALPPIYFKPISAGEGSDSHMKEPKHTNLNDINNLVKIGHSIETSMIPETYLNSEIFLKHFVKCDTCGKWIRWKLSPGMEGIRACGRCVCSIVSDSRKRDKSGHVF